MSLSNMLRSSMGLSESGGHMMMAGERVSSRVLGTGGMLGGAALAAWVNGRYPSENQDHLEISFQGKSVPADLLAGGLGVFLGWTGFLGDYSEIGTDVAEGFLAEYVVRKTYKAATEARAAAVIGKADAQQQMASGRAGNGAGGGVIPLRQRYRQAMSNEAPVKMTG